MINLLLKNAAKSRGYNAPIKTRQVPAAGLRRRDVET
jgi:hypothetical protein